MDRRFGASWHVVVGEQFGFEITHEVSNLLYMFFGGNLAICVWKCTWISMYPKLYQIIWFTGNLNKFFSSVFYLLNQMLPSFPFFELPKIFLQIFVYFLFLFCDVFSVFFCAVRIEDAKVLLFLRIIYIFIDDNYVLHPFQITFTCAIFNWM